MTRARFVSVAAREFLRQSTPAAASTRRVLVRDFPFSVVYRADQEGILVFAVAHSARRPDYWRSRIR